MKMNRTPVNTVLAVATPSAPLPHAPQRPHRVPLGQLASTDREALHVSLHRVLPDADAAGRGRVTVSAFNSSI
jgi:FXSXX-COOH protein